MNHSTSSCQLITLSKISDARGNLSFVEGQNHIPFEIKRVFYLYDVPAGETRAGHALRDCEQFLVALSGSFDVVVDDGDEKQTFTLNRPWVGLYIPPMYWRELDNFASGSVCLVLASEVYGERFYIRDYQDFIQLQKKEER